MPEVGGAAASRQGLAPLMGVFQPGRLGTEDVAGVKPGSPPGPVTRAPARSGPANTAALSRTTPNH